MKPHQSLNCAMFMNPEKKVLMSLAMAYESPLLPCPNVATSVKSITKTTQPRLSTDFGFLDHMCSNVQPKNP